MKVLNRTARYKDIEPHCARIRAFLLAASYEFGLRSIQATSVKVLDVMPLQASFKACLNCSFPPPELCSEGQASCAAKQCDEEGTVTD